MKGIHDMKYLFFDIECANCEGGNGKICSFGYVKTDEKFRVLENRDIIINPRSEFRLQNFSSKKYIELAYPESEFLSAEDFREHYPEIKDILKEEELLIFGYAVENDAGFLRSEFERYRLECVNFRFYDVQRLYCKSVGKPLTQMCSLSDACLEAGIETSCVCHKSSDDAFLTMKLLEKITEVKGKSVPELLGETDRISGTLENGEIYAEYFKNRNFIKPGEENLIRGKNKDDYKNFLRRLALRSYKQKATFSGIYEHRHFKEMVVLVSMLAERGIGYTDKASDADIYIRKPQNAPGICSKEEYVKELNLRKNATRKIEIMWFGSMLRTLGLTPALLKEKAEDYERILTEVKNETLPV